jgi:enamine deaminase RidA (YjgF/YER057c/UK114 family)
MARIEQALSNTAGVLEAAGASLEQVESDAVAIAD